MREAQWPFVPLDKGKLHSFSYVVADSTPERLEFYEFIRSLDAMEKTMTGNKTLVLPIDSPLTKMFLDYNK